MRAIPADEVAEMRGDGPWVFVRAGLPVPWISVSQFSRIIAMHAVVIESKHISSSVAALNLRAAVGTRSCITAAALVR